jgi:hypothetical protein
MRRDSAWYISDIRLMAHYLTKGVETTGFHGMARDRAIFICLYVHSIWFTILQELEGFGNMYDGKVAIYPQVVTITYLFEI